MDLQLEGKVVLVTGGSKGIGEAIVRCLLAEGARVANINRSTEEGVALEQEYAGQGKDCFFIQADLTDVDACRQSVEAVLERFGRIDVGINNAGVNDSIDDARRLGDLLRGLPAKVNLIPWNALPTMPYQRPSPEHVESFRIAARDTGLDVLVRYSRGADFAAACGELHTSEVSDGPGTRG